MMLGRGMIELKIEIDGKIRNFPAAKVRFSPYLCFPLQGKDDERHCLHLLGHHLLSLEKPFACFGDRGFFEAIIESCPELLSRLAYVNLDERCEDGEASFRDVPVVFPEELPDHVNTVFLAERGAFNRWRLARRLREGVEVISPEILPRLDWRAAPRYAWLPHSDDIYPTHIPELEFSSGQDMILLDVPARNMALMPNGLAYVHNALKKEGITFQTVDADIILYHRFHIRRLYDDPDILTHSDGLPVPEDPWLAEHYDFWNEPRAFELFQGDMEEIINGIIAAKPKILGISVQQCNEKFAEAVARGVKDSLPDIAIIAGGFSCYNPTTAREAAPYADYICVFEADYTVGPLVRKILAGEKVKEMPGVISLHDLTEDTYKPGPVPHDLDELAFPKYEWYGIPVYRNWNGYQLTPVIASRGCRWSRCTFCAERFIWRIHTAESFVDELEWLYGQGCDLFMLNESDLSGMPERLVEICEEIIRRGLKVKLTGQLRVHKKCDRAFFDTLKKAGFVALRFGVDAWSRNTLRLQKKGYTVPMIHQTLKDCWEAGIYTEVNTIVGVPGETDEDIEESIRCIIENKPYIGRIANVNPLIFANGSIYWENPENHGIMFRGSQEDIFQKHKRAIPAHLWYSTSPYIDHDVRTRRFEQVIMALYDSGFEVGEWAAKIFSKVTAGDDEMRGGKVADKYAAASRSMEDADWEVVPSFGDARDGPLSSEMLADALSPLRKTADTADDKQIIKIDGEFYTVSSSGELPSLLKNGECPDAFIVKTRVSLFPYWIYGIIHLFKSPHRIFKYGRKTYDVLRDEGAESLFVKVRDYLEWNSQRH